MTALSRVHPEAALFDHGGDAEIEAIARSTDLEQLTRIVRQGRRTFLEVGWALWRVRSAKLYKLTHRSWESWLQDHWWGTKRQADRTIQAATTVVEMGLAGKNVPTEAAAIELSKLPPQDRPEALAEASVHAGGRPTAADVREVVERRADGRKKSPGLQTRRTPRWLFEFLAERFGPYRLDAYADASNALCERFFDQDQDGNTSEWVDVTFANPEFRDMRSALEQAVRMAERGIRSTVIGPVGCSQGWCHELAIRGTEYRPTRRINFDLPSGEPTDGADRDTIVMCFGGPHANPYWRRGEFRVLQLPLPEVP